MRKTLAFGEPLDPIEIRGERVTLRTWSAVDLPAVGEAAADAFLRSMTTLPETSDEADYQAFIDRQDHRLASGEGWALAITDDPAAPALGHVGIWTAAARKGQVEFGYWMVPSARRRGLMTDALRAATEWAFENLEVHRASLFIEPWNEASQRTAVAAGYEREAMLRKWQTVGGTARDMDCYTRLHDDIR